MEIVTDLLKHFVDFVWHLDMLHMVIGGVIALLLGVATGTIIRLFVVPILAAVAYIAADAAIPMVLHHTAFVMPVFDKVLLYEAITLYVAFFMAIFVVFVIKNALMHVFGQKRLPASTGERQFGLRNLMNNWRKFKTYRVLNGRDYVIGSNKITYDKNSPQYHVLRTSLTTIILLSMPYIIIGALQPLYMLLLYYYVFAALFAVCYILNYFMSQIFGESTLIFLTPTLISLYIILSYCLGLRFTVRGFMKSQAANEHVGKETQDMLLKYHVAPRYIIEFPNWLGLLFSKWPIGPSILVISY
ncbi:MAG: hypothetical protein WCA78_06925 [Rhizomicrobium sp.]